MNSPFDKKIKKSGHLIGYARVSTDDQDLTLQKDALIKYGVSPLDIYEDKATGKNMNRKGWQFLLKDARAGDTIVVWKVDRLSRSVYEGIQTVIDLLKRDVCVVSLDGMCNFDTTMGRIMFYQTLIYAELEVLMVRDRTLAGLAVAKANNRFGGRKRIITDDIAIDAYRWVYRDEKPLSDYAKAYSAKLGMKRPLTDQAFWNRFALLTDDQKAEAMLEDKPKPRAKKKEKPQ